MKQLKRWAERARPTTIANDNNKALVRKNLQLADGSKCDFLILAVYSLHVLAASVSGCKTQ